MYPSQNCNMKYMNHILDIRPEFNSLSMGRERCDGYNGKVQNFLMSKCQQLITLHII